MSETESGEEDSSGDESWSDALAWACCICRGDGVPMRTRLLELVSRLMFQGVGLCTGRPQDFRRNRWDFLTSSQMVESCVDARVVCSDVFAPGLPELGDYPPVPVRVYSPATADEKEALPVLLFFHGGGFCIQSCKAKSAHDFVYLLVQKLRCRAVSVEYRLAPEFPFPCALRDAYTVLRWLHSCAKQQERNDLINTLPSMRIPVNQIVPCGDSAGGNLALVLSTLVSQGLDPEQRQDPKGPSMQKLIKHIALIYPCLFEFGTASAKKGCMRYFLPKKMLEFYKRSYMGDDRMAELLADWRVAPLKTSSFKGLPDVSVISADLDPIRDENMILVQRLKKDGVKVSHMQALRAPHGFLTLPSWASDKDLCERCLAFICQEVQASLSSS